MAAAATSSASIRSAAADPAQGLPGGPDLAPRSAEAAAPVGTAPPARAVSQPRVLWLIAAVTILWGLNWPAMKLAVGEFPPWTFRAICTGVGGSTLLVLAALLESRVLPLRQVWRPLLLISLFSVTGWHMLTAYGLLYVGGGRAAIIAYTMPVWAALLGVVVLHERLSGRRLAALLIGMLAMALLLVPDLARLGGAPWGVLLITGAAMAWAAGIIGTKAFDWQLGTLALTGWQLLLGGIPIVLVGPFVEHIPDLRQVSTAGWLTLAYVIFVALVFCFSTHVRLVRMLPATVAALATLVIPVVGVVSSALLLGERVGLGEAAALAMVLIALALVLVPQRQRGREA